MHKGSSRTIFLYKCGNVLCPLPPWVLLIILVLVEFIYETISFEISLNGMPVPFD